MDADGFRVLAQRLATAWEALDTETAVGCFTEDAVYMEPPDNQLFVGHEQLRPYFGALEEGTRMTFHHLWFDPEGQVGVGEYTFGMASWPTAVHGVAVLEIRDGRIAQWREFQRRGPREREAFLAQDGKEWHWSIHNYP
jgi:ketosteroid isomerase-like protein